MKLKLQYSDEWITLAPTPFAGGGEGNLYHIIRPRHWSKYVAKIYHPHKRSTEREQKISYLAKYPPVLSTSSQGHPSVVWVKDALYNNSGEFVGLIMPFIKGKKLEILCTPKIPRKLRSQWSRFSFKHSNNSLDMRLKLSFNICAAIHQIHDVNRYVLVDMKPDNIIIQPNGLVAVVDTDSVEVVEDGKTLFDAPVATPEYSPPEHYRKLENDPTQQQAWDCFGLGVILYKLLFGIHPFAAASAAPYEQLVSLDDKIKAGLFVHDPKLSHSFKVIPPLHQAFYDLDPALQDLFFRCFVEGHTNPAARPSAEEWCATLLYVMDDEAAMQRFGHILGISKTAIIKRPQFPLPSRKVTITPPSQPRLNTLVEQLSTQLKSLSPRYIPVNPNHQVYFDRDNTKWSNSAILGTIFFMIPIAALIGGFVLPIILLLALFANAYNKNNLVKDKKNRDNLFKRKRDRYKKVKQRAINAQKSYSRLLGQVAKQVEQIGQQIKQKKETLTTYLRNQDQKVAKIEAEALDIYKHLTKKYLDLAMGNRLVARVADVQENSSISRIRIEINKDYQQAIQEMTKKVSLEEQSPTFQQGKTEIANLIASKKIAIEDIVEQKKQAINEKPDNRLEEKAEELKKAADIPLHIKRVWSKKWFVPTNQKKRLIEAFDEVGLSSILQIKRIDLNKNYIFLQNGAKLKLRDKKYLRSLLQWQDEIKHLKTSYIALKKQVQEEKKIAIESLEKNSRIEIGQLKTEERQKIKELEIIAHREILGEPYEAVQQQYATASSFISELETAQKEEQEVLMGQLQEEYQQIMIQAEQKAASIAAAIQPLEAQLKKLELKLDQPAAYKKHKAVERQLSQLKESINELQQAKYEKERYKKITFPNYIAKLVRLG